MINGNNIKLLVFKKHDLKSKKYLSWLNQSNFRFSDNRFKKYDNISLRRFYKIFDFKKNYLFKIIIFKKEFVGTISCYIDSNHKTAHLGILIGEKKFKNKGLGFKAWKLLGDYLFKKKKIRKLYAGTMSLNKPMLSIFRKYGMKHEASIKKHHIFNGKYYDILIFSKFK